jgi:hypothetical protein
VLLYLLIIVILAQEQVDQLSTSGSKLLSIDGQLEVQRWVDSSDFVDAITVHRGRQLIVY